jgi:hypothetical protein
MKGARITATLVLGAVIAVAAGVGLAGGRTRAPHARASFVFHTISWTFMDKGDIHGLIAGRQKTESSAAKITVSLHGLTRNTPTTAPLSYQIVGSTRPCSKPATKTTSPFHFKLNVVDNADVFQIASTSTARVHSTRLFASTDQTLGQQVACAVTVLDNEAKLT